MNRVRFPLQHFVGKAQLVLCNVNGKLDLSLVKLLLNSGDVAVRRFDDIQLALCESLNALTVHGRLRDARDRGKRLLVRLHEHRQRVGVDIKTDVTCGPRADLVEQRAR